MASAALNFALVVSRPFESKIGPLPVPLAVGRLMPFSRIHAENLTSAALNAGLLKWSPAPAWPKPPHFLIAARYCWRVTPFGRLNSFLPRPPRNVPRWPGVGVGSVMPSFLRHSRTVAKRAPKRPVDPLGVDALPPVVDVPVVPDVDVPVVPDVEVPVVPDVEVPVVPDVDVAGAPVAVDVAALAFAVFVVVEPLDELPHAASTTLASASRRRAATAADLDLLLES